MKKRWYALIPALILLVVLIGIVGWKIGHPAENTQPEYSLTIADPVTTEISSSDVVTEQTTVSSGRTTKAATTPWAQITEGRRGDYQNPEHTDC